MVVSYRNSTSNHNREQALARYDSVVSYRNSTSNHNGVLELRSAVLLYLIEILHQTTTEGLVWLLRYVLYLIEILHQTTTEMVAYISFILLYLIEILHQTTTIFYKLAQRLLLYLIEILHQTTTSKRSMTIFARLYLIEILHQTTTRSSMPFFKSCCILSKFYIKPQLWLVPLRLRGVVSYRNSTSNHNCVRPLGRHFKLYLIEILHQTTTNGFRSEGNVVLYLIEILHQTTTAMFRSIYKKSCILSKFYIKPQP